LITSSSSSVNLISVSPISLFSYIDEDEVDYIKTRLKIILRLNYSCFMTSVFGPIFMKASNDFHFG